MIYSDMTTLMKRVFREVEALREAGQKEYARDSLNSFANFERVAEWLGIPREKVLLNYLLKHMDGVCAYVNGHRSQREDVRGRLNDIHVYCILLRGMIDSAEQETVGGQGPQIDAKPEPTIVATPIHQR